MKPLIFDIRRFSLDDGPGIRTTVFFKGCPLSCLWCHNPESVSPKAEIVFYPTRCINCGECEKVCFKNAVQLNNPSRIMRERCDTCAACVKECPSTALKTAGEYYSVNELLNELMKDNIFYETSQGGVTFSGGEPTLHMDYLGNVAKALKEYGIHTAIQTSGKFDIQEFREKLIPHIDLIFYDIKIFDSQKHEKYTGVGNKTILENFISLADERGITLIPRTPLIPGITAPEENLLQIASFVRSAGCKKYELLPYNPNGLGKTQAIGSPAPQCLPRTMMTSEEERRCRDTIQY